jgi:small subunit ribosomal protein S21
MPPRLDDSIAHVFITDIFSARLTPRPYTKECQLQVFVRDNNVDQALRVLKKKMQREGVFREMKRRRFYEKPSEQTTREKSEAIRRSRKLARKKAIIDGSIKAPRKKPGYDANGKPKPAERGRPSRKR